MVVSVSATHSQDPDGNIVQYRWEFGDGTISTAATTTHVYSQADTYTLRLTVTDDDGNTTTATRSIYVYAPVQNGTGVVPSTALFYDGFDYVASRSDANVANVFRNRGWSGAKTAQDPNSRNPRGYVYTTNTVPGYSGTFPGVNSTHVLALEARPTSMGDPNSGNWGDMQTDFYLQFGSESSPTTNIPNNVWFQFWLYTTGNFDRGMKLIYPCRIHYPCTNGQWLATMGSTSQEPYWHEFSMAGEPVPDAYLQFYGVGANYSPSAAGADGNDLGQTNVSEHIANGRWVLVKIHIDTSGPQGVYEAWLKPMGGQQVKVAEFIGGVTQNFSWPINNNEGHRQFRMPTTVGGPRAVTYYPQSYDSTLYIDDFTMAQSESDLPIYPY